MRKRESPPEPATLVVLHEYGAPSHYTGTLVCARELDPETVVRWVEFGFLRSALRGLARGNPGALGKALRDAGWLIACWLRPARLSGCTVVIGVAPFDWRLLLLRRVVSRARVIHHSSWPYWSVERAPRTPHGLLAGPVLAVWRRFLREDVVGCACVTHAVRDAVADFSGLGAERTPVVHHAVDVGEFFDPGHRVREPVRAIFVGRLVPEKGLDTVVEIARRCPSVQFTIVGDGPMRNFVERSADRLPNLEYDGLVVRRESLREKYARAHYVLQPSRRNAIWEELFGLSIIEGMACGCVPLASDHVGPSSILGGTRELAPGLLPEERFADEAVRLIESSSTADLQDRSNAAARRARDFDAGSIAKRWRELLDRDA